MLDAEFTWVTQAGVVLSRASVLSLMPKPAILDAGSYTLEAHRYGTSLAVVQRHSGSTHALNVWVKRPDRWKLLHTAEVVEGERVVYGGTLIGRAPCINPCETVPFVPATPTEGAVMAAWQAQQSGPELWGRLQDPTHIQALLKRFDAKLFVVGHCHAEMGIESPVDGLVVINSDHARGVVVRIELSKPLPSPDEIVKSAMPLVLYRALS